MSNFFNIEEYQIQFTHMTEESRKELLIKFDRNLLENDVARNFLRQVSNNDESFSVRYLARKLVESFEKKPHKSLSEDIIQQSDNSEIKMVSSFERLKKENIEKGRKAIIIVK